MLVYYAAPDEKTSATNAPKVKSPAPKKNNEKMGTLGEKKHDGNVSEKKHDGNVSEKKHDGLAGQGQEGLEGQEGQDGQDLDGEFVTLGEKDEKKEEEKPERQHLELGSSDIIDVILEWGYKALDKQSKKLADKAADLIEKNAKKVIKELDMLATPNGAKTWEARKDKWDKWVKEVSGKDMDKKDKKALEKGVQEFEKSEEFSNSVEQNVDSLSKEGQKSKQGKKNEEKLVGKANNNKSKTKNLKEKEKNNKKRKKEVEKAKASKGNKPKNKANNNLNNVVANKKRGGKGS